MDAIEVPVIETERLYLRQLTEADIPFIFELFSREETNLHDTYEPIRTEAEARELYEQYIKPSLTLFRLGMFLKSTDQAIGTLGLYGVDKCHKRAILGYDLLREHWGKGYATEAVASLIDYSFNELNLNRIHASADIDNKRSLAVLERLGFTREGVMRQKDFYKGAFHDDVVYSMLKSEWSTKVKKQASLNNGI